MKYFSKYSLQTQVGLGSDSEWGIGHHSGVLSQYYRNKKWHYSRQRAAITLVILRVIHEGH